MRQPIFLFIIVCFMLFSLSRDRKDNSLKTKYYPNGKIESIRHFKYDSIEIGTSKYFYETGAIKDSLEFAQNKKNGWHWHFNEEGSLVSKIHFLNDVQSGESFFYYRNGKIKSQSFWFEGEPLGDALFFYNNGQIKMYNCNDFFGTNIYALSYDSLGNKLQDAGKVFSDNLKSNFDTSQKVKVNDTLVVQLIVSKPPNVKSYLEISFTHENELPRFEKCDISHNIVTFSKKINKKGFFRFCVRGYLKNELDGSISKRDSSCYELEVLR